MTLPAHLEPSKLGTREYWDELYTQEIANHSHDPTDTGTAWFDDSDAEAKLLEFLEDPDHAQELGLDTVATSFLDLGTGNGALLFALRDAGWEGPMLGVDYSAQSVRFARRIERARRLPPTERRERNGDGEADNQDDARQEDAAEEDDGEVDVHFAEHDILHSSAEVLLDERFSPSVSDGWDVILDKGTFDAISLSAETLDQGNDAGDDATNTNTSAPAPATTGANLRPGSRRVNEAYGARILPLVREGGLFLITSCNWTEAELRSWFEADGAVQEMPTAASNGSGNEGQQQAAYWGFEVVGRVEYRSFSFGGVKGQTISSLCFRKVRKSR
ncbi:hypothetical protein F5Y03DRAFT_208670 [Xylaria venustula]|nr:hypothetical protein F5Y03DRAFT_208670 [Xylaria venustula]